MAGRSFMGGGGYRLGVSQSIAVTATSASATNPFGAETWAVRIAFSGTGLCHYRIGDGAQTALTSDAFIPNTEVEVVLVSPSQRIAAVCEATGTGTLTVTELVQ